MIFTPEERRALMAVLGLLLLGQVVSLWQEHRRRQPDRELSLWLNRLSHARGDSLNPGGVDSAGLPLEPDSAPAALEAPEEPPAPVEPRSAIPAGLLETGRLQVNLAGASDLEALPGVGPALAGKIVAERERSGPFLRPEDLLRVSGIGPKKLAAMRERIDFAPPAGRETGNSRKPLAACPTPPAPDSASHP